MLLFPSFTCGRCCWPRRQADQGCEPRGGARCCPRPGRSGASRSAGPQTVPLQTPGRPRRLTLLPLPRAACSLSGPIRPLGLRSCSAIASLALPPNQLLSFGDVSDPARDTVHLFNQDVVQPSPLSSPKTFSSP